MTNSVQDTAEEVKIHFFRHFFFWFGVVLNVAIGCIGLFGIVQSTVFGLIYVQIPAFDWMIYAVLGMSNIPWILMAIYCGFIVLVGGLFFLLWRRFLTPLEEKGEVSIGFSAGLYMISGLFPATVYVITIQVQLWLAVSSGYTFITKLIGNFIGLPVLGVCFGIVLSTILVFRRLSRKYHLFVIEERRKMGLGVVRRRMRITVEPKPLSPS
jgi:hypothetical protein